jgi:hypothetical protein
MYGGGGGCFVGGGGGGVSIDGGPPLPFGTFGEGSLAGGESAYLCPPGGCFEPGLDPLTGQLTILEFMAGAGGATGWLSTYDIQQGLNEVNGTFMTDALYTSYLNAVYSGAIQAQRQALALAIANNSNSQISYDEALRNLSEGCVYVQGGNCNFSYTFNSSLVCGGQDRCNGIHFTDSGTVHLDTSNPWSGIWGFLEHAFVDVFLGNVAYYIIPRPWP